MGTKHHHTEKQSLNVTDIVLILAKLIVLSPYFLGKLFLLFCFLVRIAFIYQNQICTLMCSGKFISLVPFSFSKITFVRLMSPKAGLSCCYLWGAKMEKNQMTHLFPSLGLSFPIWITTVLPWRGRSEWQDNWESVCILPWWRVDAEQQSSPFQQVHFVASQRRDSQISTMGIIPPRLCWSFHWLREAAPP